MSDAPSSNSSSGASPADSNSASLEASIRRRAQEFEIGALLALLRRRFPERRLGFRSHASMGLRPSAVHDVEFAPDTIFITLNIGFFTSTSVLPSYFHEWLAGPEPVRGLDGILGMLDDRLLRDRAEAAAVPKSSRLLPGAPSVRRSLLQLARPASAGTLRWLFARIYPELGVSVARAGVHRAFSVAELRLGHAQLGHTAMGGEADVLTPGYDVFLTTGESTTWSGKPWPYEVRRRLDDSVFPALAETSVNLRVFLLDFEGSMRLALVRASTFGFDPLARAASPHVITVFEGRVARSD